MVGCISGFDEVETEVQPTNVISEAEEMNIWIYQQMKHYYLWNYEIPDSIECDFKLTPTEFYNSILSSKDRFSHMLCNRSRNDNIGFAYQAYKTQNGEVIYQVLYITCDNAKLSGLKRGDLVRLKKSDGVNVCLEIIKINHNISSTKEISYEINVDNSSYTTVLLDSVYHIGSKRVGYLCYLEYGEPEDFHLAFKRFKNENINELILDLRYNPGGIVNTCKKLCSLIAPTTAYGNIFQQNSYNSIIASENLKVYGHERTYTYFEEPNNYATPLLGKKYDFLSLDNIYILTSSHTASASEATICCLKPYMNVVTIGAKTVGKGVGMRTISSAKYKYTLQPITFRYYNSIGETVPDSGIVPDYVVEDSYFMPKSEIGDINESLLSTALELISSDAHGCKSIKPSYHNIEVSLTPIGEPSYVTEFKNKHYNESN